jgi:ribosomal protein S18 acetylase RimI-like enzyme
VVNVRTARAGDLLAIRDFTADTFEWGDYVPDEFPTWLTEPEVMVMVATTADDKAIAMARVALLSSREAWLSAARVHPEFRRQGIGSMINDHGVDWARDQGAAVMRLAIEVSNTAARKQVEKIGYRAVAQFALARRRYEKLGPATNGGKRPPADERLDLAPSSEAEPAYLVWASGDYPGASHGLYASDGWAFRQLQAADLARSARRRQLWSSPSAWAVIEPDEDRLWLPLFLTTPEDARRGARALTDLGREHNAGTVTAMIPRIKWLEEALIAEHFEIQHPNYVYEKPL